MSAVVSWRSLGGDWRNETKRGSLDNKKTLEANKNEWCHSSSLALLIPRWHQARKKWSCCEERQSLSNKHLAGSHGSSRGIISPMNSCLMILVTKKSDILKVFNLWKHLSYYFFAQLCHSLNMVYGESMDSFRGHRIPSNIQGCHVKCPSWGNPMMIMFGDEIKKQIILST